MLQRTIRKAVRREVTPIACYERVATVVDTYLWPEAGERHGFILGHLLAIPLIVPIRNLDRWLPPVHMDQLTAPLEQLWSFTGDDPASPLARPWAICELVWLVLHWQADVGMEKHELLEQLCSTDIGLLPRPKCPFVHGQPNLFMEPISWERYAAWLEEWWYYPDRPTSPYE